MIVPYLPPPQPTHHHVFGPPTRHPSPISELQRERPTLNQICYFNPSTSRLLSRLNRASFKVVSFGVAVAHPSKILLSVPTFSAPHAVARAAFFFLSHTATTRFYRSSSKITASILIFTTKPNKGWVKVQAKGTHFNVMNDEKRS